MLGLGEVRPGDDLAALLAEALIPTSSREPSVPGGLADGDVLVVTQKVVSKAEGRLVALDADDPDAKQKLVEQESVRILRRRGDLLITETRHGFICANAGVDLSNVDAGTAALLPVDPDRSARRIREGFEHRHRVSVGVLVSDTFGRTWRAGCHRCGHRHRRHRRHRGPPGHRRRQRPGPRRHRGVRGRRAGRCRRAGHGQGPRASRPPCCGGWIRRWLRPGSVATEIVRPPGEDLFR